MTDEDAIKLLQIYYPDVPSERIEKIIYNVRKQFDNLDDAGEYAHIEFEEPYHECS